MPFLDITTVIIRNVNTGMIEVIRLGKLFSRLGVYEHKNNEENDMCDSRGPKAELGRWRHVPNYEVWSHQGWTKIKSVQRRRIVGEENIYALHNGSNWIYATGGTALLLGPSSFTHQRREKRGKIAGDHVDGTSLMEAKYNNRQEISKYLLTSVIDYISIPALRQIIVDYVGPMLVCVKNINGIEKLYECGEFPRGNGPNLREIYPPDSDEPRPFPNGDHVSTYCNLCPQEIVFREFHHCEACQWDICLNCVESRKQQNRDLICPMGHNLELIPRVRSTEILSTRNLEQQKVYIASLKYNSVVGEFIKSFGWTDLQTNYLVGTMSGHRVNVCRAVTADGFCCDFNFRSYQEIVDTFPPRKSSYKKFRKFMDKNFPKKFKLLKFVNHPSLPDVTYDPWLNDGIIMQNIIDRDETKLPFNERSVVHFNKKTDWLYSLDTGNGFYNVGIGRLVAKGTCGSL